ncbi:MAG: hypothetical protein KAI43_10215 [Candidatus Aureabacteria bacterium]|nr:hypothetical protein [Candidatus Auribacterota bacterium]
MSKLIKIILSPFSAALETVYGLVIRVQPPYTDNEVNIQISPNITEYKETVNKDFKQFTMTSNIEDTKHISLNLKSKSTQIISFEDKDYEIKLLNIGKVKQQGQDFPFFEFMITET